MGGGQLVQTLLGIEMKKSGHNNDPRGNHLKLQFELDLLFYALHFKIFAE